MNIGKEDGDLYKKYYRQILVSRNLARNEVPLDHGLMRRRCFEKAEKGRHVECAGKSEENSLYEKYDFFSLNWDEET